MKRHFLSYLRSRGVVAQFLRFATVGAKISVIDAGLLYLLHWPLGWSLYAARIVSLGTAIFAGYFLNRYFTFHHFPRGNILPQLLTHLGVHLIGSLVNYGIFSLVVTLGLRFVEGTLELRLLPLLALWVGGMVGMLFNFLCSRRFVFRHRAKLPATTEGGGPPSFASVGRECENEA